MPVTPLVAPYRASIFYSCDSQSHRMDLLGDALPGGGGTSGYQWQTADTIPVDTDDAVQAFAAVFAAIMPASNATIDTWTLEQYVAGAYFPVYSNAIGLPGTSSLARSTLNRMTVVFRDHTRLLVRNVALGVSLIAPQHGAAAGAGVFGTYFADFVTASGLHVGNWVTGRANQFLDSALKYTVSLDRKSRRRAGNI